MTLDMWDGGRILPDDWFPEAFENCLIVVSHPLNFKHYEKLLLEHRKPFITRAATNDYYGSPLIC